MNYSGDSLLGMFLFETTQLLEQLEESILNTEHTSSFTQEDINEIFRIMHTIKGSAAMMQYHNVSKLAHALEDLFDYLRSEENVEIDYSALTDLVFANVDFINEQIGKIEEGATEDDDATELINANRDFLAKIKNEDKGQSSSGEANASGNGKAGDGLQAEKNANFKYSYKATIYFSEGCEMENIRAFGIINNLEEVAGDIKHIPEDLMASEAAEEIKSSGFRFVFNSNCTYVDIHQLLMQTIFLKELELEQVDTSGEAKSDSKTLEANQSQASNVEKNQEATMASDVKKGQEDTTRQKQAQRQRPNLTHQSIISVPVEKLDKLMDLMGEFVISEAMVTQNPDLVGLELPNFEKSALQLKKITKELQEVVMSIRMVPLSATFNKMKRIVRDMGKKLDKEVTLTILGEETEVDKNIIEHISDPLMHLVRNALDHGLETKEDRIKAGKPAVGNIKLEAKNVGSDVLIIVQDDGKGINKDSIIRKAKEKGLLKRPVESMSDKDIFNLILLPGFSTNENVTEYSGRGVGMDVVTKGIEAIGGSVSIDSIEHVGTAFTMKIPLTLAIVDGMNVSVGESIYTIPTMNIKEFFKPVLEDIIIDPDKNEMVIVRGECYPILRLHNAFKVDTDVTDFEDGIFIIVKHDQHTICLFVDRLIGQQQIVVKALPEYILRSKRVKGLAGCTLLGDGSISLIIDVSGLNDLL